MLRSTLEDVWNKVRRPLVEHSFCRKHQKLHWFQLRSFFFLFLEFIRFQPTIRHWEWLKNSQNNTGIWHFAQMRDPYILSFLEQSHSFVSVSATEKNRKIKIENVLFFLLGIFHEGRNHNWQNPYSVEVFHETLSREHFNFLWKKAQCHSRFCEKQLAVRDVSHGSRLVCAHQIEVVKTHFPDC